VNFQAVIARFSTAKLLLAATPLLSIIIALAEARKPDFCKARKLRIACPDLMCPRMPLRFMCAAARVLLAASTTPGADRELLGPELGVAHPVPVLHEVVQNPPDGLAGAGVGVDPLRECPRPSGSSACLPARSRPIRRASSLQPCAACSPKARASPVRGRTHALRAADRMPVDQPQALVNGKQRQTGLPVR